MGSKINRCLTVSVVCVLVGTRLVTSSILEKWQNEEITMQEGTANWIGSLTDEVESLLAETSNCNVERITCASREGKNDTVKSSIKDEVCQ